MSRFVEFLTSANSTINNLVWGIPALILLVGTGIWITIRTHFFQFKRFGFTMKKTVGSLFSNPEITKSQDKRNISQFQALCTALSATIGTGNIAGIAYAITMGGPGAIFWMWIAAIAGMMTNYAENVLGIYYRRRNTEGQWCGGAMYYLQDGVGSMKHCKKLGKILACLFSVFAVVASFGIGNMGQVVSISQSLVSVVHFTESTKTDALIIGLAVMVASALVIIGGLQRIAKANEKIVPFMAGFYIIGAVIIICINADRILPAFASIFKNAFNVKSAAGGIGGSLLMQGIKWGFKRGVFSNEAGLGSSVMVHSNSNVKEPAVQGFWGIFEVFIDTIVVCTLTALVILTTNVVDLNTGLSISGQTKLGLATEAFSASFGPFGGIFIAIAISLFAFSTVLGWSFYGSKAWEYLFGTKSIPIYKTLFLAVIVLGSTVDASLVIDLSDTFNGLMAIPNLIGVLCLSGLVVKITDNYIKRKITCSDLGLRPLYSAFSEIQEENEKA